METQVAPQQEAWFALCVKSRAEKTASTALRGRGLEELTPMRRERRHWSDRMQEVEKPLFPGYVFCRFNWSKRLPVLTAPGVMSVVSFANQPAPVEDDEIQAIRKLMSSNLRLEPWPYWQVGDRVRIEYGAMAGVEGTLVQDRGASRVVVSVNLIQRSVAVEIDRDWLSTVGK